MGGFYVVQNLNQKGKGFNSKGLHFFTVLVPSLTIQVVCFTLIIRARRFFGMQYLSARSSEKYKFVTIFSEMKSC